LGAAGSDPLDAAGHAAGSDLLDATEHAPKALQGIVDDLV
jgi:hypothetical protein